MKIYKIITFLAYPAIMTFVYFVNPSLELLFILAALLFSFLVINSTTNRKIKSIKSFRYPAYSLDLLFFVIYILLFPTIYQTLSSIIQGRFFELGLKIAVSRYTGKTELSIWDLGATSITFTISLLLGLCNSNQIKKRHYLLYTLILVTSLSGLSRTGLLINVIFLISGILIKKSDHIQKFTTKKILFTFTLLTLSAFLLYGIPQYGRVYDKENAIEIVFNKFSAYSTNIYFAFSEYIKDFERLDYSKEFKTFGIFSKIFGVDKIRGTYKSISVSSGHTNIFTWLRGLVEDFGFLLFPFIIFTFYFFSVYSFKTNSKILFVVTFWTIPFFLYPFYSVFYFNNVLLGYVLFSFIVLSSKTDFHLW